MAEKTIEPDVKNIVNHLAERLRRDGVNVEKIVVFGSREKGTAGPESDLDIIIVSEDFRGKDLFQRADMIFRTYGDTVRKFMVGIDIIMETPEEFNPDFGTVVYAA